jgi:hypothetical protein
LAQLTNLNLRSGFEYFLFGCRNQVDHMTSPIVHYSETGAEFISNYLKFETARLALHFDAYATNRAGVNGKPMISLLRA